MSGQADDPDDDGFLRRWSRRKRGIEPDEAGEESGGPAQTLPRDPAKPDEDEFDFTGMSDTDILERLGLRDPDTLSPGDDFKAFMRRAVPEHLRKRALRRLWRSNPVLANLDGLNDYDGDFTGGSVATGSLKTAYVVGRGLIRQILDKDDAAARNEASETDGIDPAEAAADDPVVQVAADTVSRDENNPSPLTGEADQLVSRPRRRRMAFAHEPDDTLPSAASQARAAADRPKC